MFYGSFQMDHGAFYCKLKGAQRASESQATIYTLITSCQCFIIPLYLYLNISKSSDSTKVMTNWVGCSTEAVQNTTSQKHNGCHLCLPAEGGGSEGSKQIGLDTKWLYLLLCSSKSHLQGDIEHTSLWEIKSIVYASCCKVTISISLGHSLFLAIVWKLNMSFQGLQVKKRVGLS